ncbi:MAG: hypothetical protein ACFFDH_11655, partial [Promethearchaeota archaeon]
MMIKKVIIKTLLVLIVFSSMSSIPLFNYKNSKNATIINYQFPCLSLKEWKSYELASIGSGSNSFYPEITMNNLGDIYVTWNEGNSHIHVNVWNATTEEWSVPTTISIGSPAYSVCPDISSDNFNNIHVVWTDCTEDYYGSGPDEDIFYRCWNYTLKQWTDIEVVSTESTSDSSCSYLDIDGNGNVHVVWEDYTNYGGSGSYESIFYKIRNSSNGLWTTTEVVSALGSYDSYLPDIAVDESGNAYVAWEQWTGTGTIILYRSRNANTKSWSSIFTITGSTSSIYVPDITIDNDLNVYLAYAGWADSQRN